MTIPQIRAPRPSTLGLLALGLALAACSSDGGGDGPTPVIPPGSADAGFPAPDASSVPPVQVPPGGMDASVRGTSDGGSDGAVATPTDASTGDASTADGATTTPSAFAQCVSSLRPSCTYEEKETACAAVSTAKIPLTAGGTWGGVTIPGGPYGAFVEWNEGKAFQNPTNILEATCDVLAGTFGEPASVTADVLNLRGADLSLYTIFRPACMHEGETFPVITWGNGTCGQTGGYGPLLATLASHGFVVVASNSRFTDGGNSEMLRALDLAKAVNEDPKHVLYKRLDLSKVGAMGHSQGAGATANAATDARIKALILWNGPGASNDKPFLAVSGERDIGSPTPASMASAVGGATKPGAWLYYRKVLETGGNVTGHLTLMEQPERVTDVTVSWWKYMLLGDAASKAKFSGTGCGLCSEKTEFEYGQKNLP
jgi:pimeloyl-ACP methyl ester carboxylesterase